LSKKNGYRTRVRGRSPARSSILLVREARANATTSSGFEESGEERLIEVKTTRFGPYTPLFLTRNEVDVVD
jgi:hypothetical protein